MGRINLIYWDKNNFGDALNPLLIEEFSVVGAVQHKDIELSLKKRLSIFAKSILLFRYKDLGKLIFPWQHTLVAIGSTIHWGNKRSSIWGAGYMNHFNRFKGGRVYAVRGKLTDRKLQEEGFRPCGVYGDPALLLPLWIAPQSTAKKYRLGIVPHWTEVDEFKSLYGHCCKIIDSRTKDIYKIVHAICECDYILSTSLHGLIVAHAYKVPALWIKKGDIETDGFKFWDYFSSVDIPRYDGFTNIQELLDNERNWLALFERHTDKAFIQNNLAKIQADLLRAAPFPIKEKYLKKEEKMGQVL
ncbi:polysaccharide pyruvyl transferase family protein [Sphingobacterium corticibacterium]|uniref:Polysaccharide pyruvyl transferase domain-containing protein n=1 Tax=Sphingobacterium corticibacterium TaxID=2484746 RepID=A0A4Q6XND9_9SPHI|nr:polysaccharide pyruvyl transferase family protein [Sphingobacterium corticibacterium]RZF61673.1 hypothetical protein EWE74_02190 [Sphingobacterium corticibacterium]